MESVDEARQVVLEIGKANVQNDEPPPIGLMAEKMGMDEQIAMEIEHMALTLNERANEFAFLKIIEGDLEGVQQTTAGAIGTAALIGYRLGCSHTAERLTSK